jgi:hypothetical protein
MNTVIIRKPWAQRVPTEKPSENGLDESEWQIMKIGVQLSFMYPY